MGWPAAIGGELRAGAAGRAAPSAGRGDTRRDHGGLVFVDLRDHTGNPPLVINPDHTSSAAELAHQIRNEFALQANGRDGLARRYSNGKENRRASSYEHLV